MVKLAVSIPTGQKVRWGERGRRPANVIHGKIVPFFNFRRISRQFSCAKTGKRKYNRRAAAVAQVKLGAAKAVAA
jgi:hypothetical protein